ncbi:WD40-repeat-containing domain protein [Calycina marina]|uniref:WD40-repeat-containing domain protein n=1 Tax=Calycina marina TaxID=1763456 RepID=A0A9P7Z8W7_9HELO|nr:WD40-repeat-containing domain protein [Calycina marina]
MLSTPLTPPLQHHILGSPHSTGAPLKLEVSNLDLQQHHSIATPASLGDTGGQDYDDRPELAGGSPTYCIVYENPSDVDQDTSDGRAAQPPSSAVFFPNTAASYAVELNEELDMLDTEAMGDENYDSMMQNQVSLWPVDFPDNDPTDHVWDDEPMFDNGPPHQVPELLQIHADLPTAMSNLSQQLQHIQDGQEFGEFGFPDMPYGTENSTVPFHFDSIPLPVLVPNASLSNFQSSTVQHPGVSFPGAAGVSGLGVDGVSLPSSQTNEPQVPLPASILPHAPQAHVYLHNSYIFNSDELVDDGNSEADPDEVEEQYNMGLADFLNWWARRSSSSWEQEPRRRPSGPDHNSIVAQRDVEQLPPMETKDLQGDHCDIQGINWKELGVSRFEARQMRRRTFTNYTNLRSIVAGPWNPRLDGSQLPDDMDYFKFRRMDFDPDINLAHFQLRNLLTCVSKDHVFYAGRHKVMHYKPVGSHDYPCSPTVAMDLTTPSAQSSHYGIQVSTLTTGHHILVAGGFNGEYGVVNLRTPEATKHCEGILTDHSNAITNHVQVHLSRHSSLPLATFASNDNVLRIIDVNTNRIISSQGFDMAVNCSAISPDQRLRVIVGDTQKVMICNSETGEILQELDGHRDYGFACDWADDGWTVATGNQDRFIKIWDARKWKNASGVSNPIRTIATEMAGVRKLKFSPIGSGKRVLVAAEPADFISVIDAETFNSKQSLSFFGEIAGFDFTNDGQDLLVGNCDPMRGGIMQFERCGLDSGASYGFEEGSRKRARIDPGGFDWLSREEDVSMHPKSRRPHVHRSRNPAQLGFDMPIF